MLEMMEWLIINRVVIQSFASHFISQKAFGPSKNEIIFAK